MEAPESPLRVGVIGLGLIAQVAHLPALVRLADRVAISHVCDVAPGLAEVIADRLPGRPTACRSWRDVLDGDAPDAVVVCTPGSHGRIAAEFLSAGVSVLAEKPLCLTTAEAEHLGELAAAGDVALEVAYMKTHDDVVEIAASMFADMSDPRLVRVTVLHPSDEPQIDHLVLLRGDPPDDSGKAEIAAAVGYEQDRAAEAVGESLTLQTLYADILSGSVVHEMSLLRVVTGHSPEWRSATAHPLDAGEPPCIQANGRLGDRTDVVLSWNWLPTFPDHETEFAAFGDDCRMVMTMEPPYTRRRTTMHVQTSRPGARHDAGTIRDDWHVTTGYESSFDLQMRNFVDQVRGGSGRNGATEARSDVAALQQLCAVIARDHGIEIGGEAAAP